MLQLSSGMFFNNNKAFKYCKPVAKGSKVVVQLDMDKGQLTYIVNGQNMGVAIQNDELKAGCFYPTFDL